MDVNHRYVYLYPQFLFLLSYGLVFDRLESMFGSRLVILSWWRCKFDCGGTWRIILLRSEKTRLQMHRAKLCARYCAFARRLFQQYLLACKTCTRKPREKVEAILWILASKQTYAKDLRISVKRSMEQILVN